MQIEDDDLAMASDEPLQDFSHLGIEGVIRAKRLLDDRGGRRAPPKVQPPGVGGRQVHRFVPGPVQVELKPRTIADDAGRGDAGPIASVRVFFVQPLCFRERQTLKDVGTYEMPIVNGASDSPPLTDLGGPDWWLVSEHAAFKVEGGKMER
jgi:hypothetical protein